MKPWIPFFQSLVWPIFILTFILIFKTKIFDLIKSIQKRIESGSEVSLGPSGISLGTVPNLEENTYREDKFLENSLNKIDNKKSPELLTEEIILKLSQHLWLIHSAQFDEEMTAIKGKRYYRIIVKLEASNEKILDKIEKVVYHLHPTFPKPDREIKTRDNYFELETSSWGQFNLSADVYFKGKRRYLRLSRYINF